MLETQGGTDHWLTRVTETLSWENSLHEGYQCFWAHQPHNNLSICPDPSTHSTHPTTQRAHLRRSCRTAAAALVSKCHSSAKSHQPLLSAGFTGNQNRWLSQCPAGIPLPDTPAHRCPLQDHSAGTSPCSPWAAGFSRATACHPHMTHPTHSLQN